MIKKTHRKKHIRTRLHRIRKRRWLDRWYEDFSKNLNKQEVKDFVENMRVLAEVHNFIKEGEKENGN